MVDSRIRRIGGVCNRVDGNRPVLVEGARAILIDDK
jgi:hypothetical protein